MLGFHNSIIKVDVSRQSSEPIAVSDDILRSRFGAKGLATYLLLEHNPPGVDPLAPANNLIFAIGPAAGTALWGSCRHGVYTKSPLTGFYAESYSGGTVADRISAAGLDAVMFCGASDSPLWIEIGENGVVFHPANDLWGKDTYATEDAIKDWMVQNRPEAKKPGVVVIGPAGENLVRLSMINNDYWRQAGRTGVGAVMGSKKIKGIAFWGNRKKVVADPKGLSDLAAEFFETNRNAPATIAFKNLGTPMMVDILDKVGALPARYWSQGRIEHREKINAPALHQHCDVTPHPCRKCFMACGRLSTVKEGRHKGLRIDGPEYETIYAFGGLCMVDSIEEILYINDQCDRLGLDTMSAGNLVAFTIEAARRGKVQAQLDYGDVEGIVELVRDIAFKRGLGSVLAEGIRYAAKKWNAEDLAVHVKGMEPSGYDPRVLKGMSLAYGTSDRGACHLRSTFYKYELGGLFDPEQIEGKAKVFSDWEDRHILMDTMVFCRFYRDFYPWEVFMRVAKLLMGLDLSEAELRAVAWTVQNDTRHFNLREGLTSQDDRLPPRLLKETLPETGKGITEAQMTLMLSEYYQARKWDPQGRPQS
jgi:aldehyde:ferredoxin oxidoreductase